MRNLIAGVVALLLLVYALRLMDRLRLYQRERARHRESERSLGRTILVEVPAGDDLILFSEDRTRFYYGERAVDKVVIRAAKLLVNGAALATAEAPGYTLPPTPSSPSIETPEGIPRDRWDVLIDTESGPVMVECGAIRERVSQELAQTVFGAVKRQIEKRGMD